MYAATDVLFGLMGGLALFLHGMSAMSRAMQQAAGAGLRRALAALTGTPLTGAITGAAATAVMQSSSAVTAAVVGLVGAGLMGLSPAIAVIFGANVGTTVTAQLTAFRPERWLGPVLLAGLGLELGGAGPRQRQAGTVLFSFGLLFLGIELMGRAAAPLAADRQFTGLLALAAERPALGLVLGAAMTAALQSSSAAIALLQTLAARTGALGLTGALPLLLGCNIGTTVTALIAAAGQGTDARRTALAHTLFNLSGALVFLPLLPLFARLTALLSPGADPARQIANAHTLFNLLCTLAWLPFTGAMARLVTALLPDRRPKK